MEILVALLCFGVAAVILKYVEYLEEKDKLALVKQESLDKNLKEEES